MQTARRLYVYLLSGVSLGVLVAGVSMLLTVLLERIGLGATGPQLAGGDVLGQQLTLASALTVVSLPVWLGHWLSAERSVRRDREGAPIERTSEIRGLYFAIAMGALLLAAATGASSVIESIVTRVAGADEFGSRSIAGGLALAIVAGAAWAYHVRTRTRDWTNGPMTAAGAWLPRAYLYLAAFAGLMFLLSGIAGLLEVAGRLLLDEPPQFSDGSSAWWAYPLASSLSGLVLGGAVWVGHLVYANALVRDTSWRGASERPAKLRLAYFVAAVIATAAGTVYLVGDGAGNLLAALLGVSEGDETAQIAGLVLLPLLSAVAYAVAWWLHARWMRAEATTSGSDDRIETEERLQLYPVALVGLAFGATAAAWLISLLIDATLGGGRALSGGDLVRRELAQWVPFALLGAGVWIWHWRAAGERRAADPSGEAASTVRRALLLIVLAVSVLAGIVASAMVLYRLFGAIFGIRQTGDAIAELALPIGVLLVAVGVALYHGAELRRDQARRAAIDASHATVAVRPAASYALRLVGPSTDDVPGLLASLRAGLPDGYELEVVDTPET